MKTKSIEGVKVKTFAPTKDQTGKELLKEWSRMEESVMD